MKKFKKVLIISSIFLLLGQIIYVASEPMVVSAVTDDILVTLTVTSGITISTGADAPMSTALGVASDSAVASSSWLVKTNDVDGYTLAVKASTDPALKDGTKVIEDYTEASAGVPDAWSVASGDKEFGYSSYGTDVAAAWGTDTDCVGASANLPSATLKYAGLSTSDKQIATRTSVTPYAGITTNICFAVEQNAVFADSGSYTATVTATAVVI